MGKIIFYLAIIIIIFTGCMGLAIKKNVIYNYYLVATDVDEDLSLSYHEPSDKDNYGFVIEATVFAVGYNDKYIIAKQHPRQFPSDPDKKITNYYILPIEKGMNWKTKNGLIGPLTQDQFKRREEELNLGNIAFTIVYKDLE